ncbi:hypothetical protein BJY00DRAFT_314238 [Aspergillus carlsbadensis]|nr:hypothetical protein BJY00DRAFT_314238 [Aspergillus carlsbadensis]
MAAAKEEPPIEVENVASDNMTQSEPPRTLMREVIAFRGMIKFLLGLYILIVSVGIDTGIGGLSLGIAAYRRQFGYYLNDQAGWVIDANYLSAMVGAGAGAQVLGAFLSGHAAARLGRIWPLRIASVIILVGTIMMLAARNIALLIVGKTVMALGIGLATTQLAPYLSELAPARIRGIIIAGINVFIVFGQWLGSLLVWACTISYPDVHDNTAWQLLFGLQLVFPTVFLVWSYWLPQSPVYLVQMNKIDAAIDAARKVYGSNYNYEAHVDRIAHEIRMENENEDANISVWEVVKGTNLRRTLIGILANTGGLLVGNAFVLSYQNYFYELAGIGGSQLITFGNYSVALVANLCSYLVIDSVGRRPLYTSGSLVLGLANFLVGFMSLVQPSNSKAAGGVSVFAIYVWSFVYQIAIGPVGWTIIGEVPSHRLRIQTNTLINMVTTVIGFGIGFAVPYIFNPDSANLGLKVGYVFGALSMVCFILTFFFLPETKGRTAGEIDRMFEQNISARNFSRTRFNQDGMPVKSDI